MRHKTKFVSINLSLLTYISLLNIRHYKSSAYDMLVRGNLHIH